MFRFFAKKLTEYSNHYIDWSRVGELIGSGSHRYTKKELLVRGGIIAFTAASGFLGAYFNDEEKTHCSSLTLSLVTGLMGFTVSHTVVILPLIKKRYEMNKECEKLIQEIETKIKKIEPPISNPCHATIQAVIEHILAISLSDDKHGRASQTWGNRKNLLTKVSEHLEMGNFDESFWEEEVDEIVGKLNDNVRKKRYLY